MAVDVDDLARIQQAHHVRYNALQDTTADLVGAAWDEYGGLDDVAAARFPAAAATISTAAQRQTSTLAVAYMTANDRLAGAPLTGLAPTLPVIRGGVPAVDVYRRSIVTARSLVARGRSVDEALAAARHRATSTARTDVSLANRGELDRGAQIRPWVVGYRRVLTGRSCAFCATASTQRYRQADLLPLHPSCDCDIAEIIGTADPGRVINQQLLDDLKRAADETGTRRYYDREAPYFVEADGSVVHGKIRRPPADAPAGTPPSLVHGDRVKVETVDHGELGPTLTNARHSTARVPDPTPEPPPPPPAPEIEERAKRAAAKKLTADDPDVVELARRYDVHPDEILTARARVADVRKYARESAAKVQADALDRLEHLGAGRIVNPPRIGQKTAQGTAARRGEWDWLERVGPRERARLSRQWYGGTQAPDQMAHTMSAALGRDIDVDEAMDLWLDLNRRSEAAGALRRGKLPSPEAYSGRIDVDNLIPNVSDDGYDLQLLFGVDDLETAAHIAQVEIGLVRDEALQYLGEAVNPVHGPAPFRMSFQTWEAEVRDLEWSIDNGFASVLDRDRYSELVPQYLDGPDLDYEELYARIVSTARKAGEEVPAHARIPWS